MQHSRQLDLSPDRSFAEGCVRIQRAASTIDKSFASSYKPKNWYPVGE